jgi:hypothetical protein
MAWQMQTGPADDPLLPYRGRPVISAGSAGRYIGRVVIELWESESEPNDVNGLAFTTDTVQGDQQTLLQRVAAALPARLARMQGS